MTEQRLPRSGRAGAAANSVAGTGNDPDTDALPGTEAFGLRVRDLTVEAGGATLVGAASFRLRAGELVVLPAPLGPRRPTTSPLSMEMDRSCTTSRVR